jgi:hypothetical protein
MKYIFIFLLSASLLSAKAQTPQCLVYHGCGGATVVAYQGDLRWSSITYDFQRFQGGSWVTIHSSVSNYHIVLNGDITLASNYRTVLRNNATSEERISNGVIVDPAKFNDPVTKPIAKAIFYWGTSATGGQNYVEVSPGNFGLSGYRPPFTYTIKKQNSFVFDIKISTTGIFFTTNIEPNQNYVFTVTDYCGNVDSVGGAFGFAAFGRVTARNCSGASIQLSSVAQGQNIAQREPVTFAVAPIADSINQFNVPESILAGLSYTYSAGISTGLTAKRYVVRAKDAFGVLSNYTVVSTGLGIGMPFVRTIGPAPGFCNVFVTLDGNPLESGIRRVSTDSLPYTFTPGATITGIRAGFDYEIVIKDSCGRISEPLIQGFVAAPPRITNVNVTNANCINTLTVTATSCTNNPEYRLQLFGQPPGNWQRSNVFTNVPGNSDEYHKVFVKDGNSSFDSSLIYVPALTARVITEADNGLCGSLYNTSISVDNGTPPFQYALSYDGINFTPYSKQAIFTNLMPGTYDVLVKDSCGNVFRATEDFQLQAGDWYYAKETGFKTNCSSNTEMAGGFIRFDIQLAYTPFAPVAPPYKYVLKEIVSNNGGNIRYGHIVRSGETMDTVFTISGLPGDKHYGIFISNSCGDMFTAKNRVVNDYSIPAGALPEPVITINSNDCNAPFLEVNDIPNQGVIKIFKGRDTTGAAVNLTSSATSAVLEGGFYTIKVSTPNFNGCPWMQLFERHINTNDSTSAGTFNVTISGICKADSSIVQLKKYVLDQTPGGTWSGNIPDSNWVNRDSGQFRTTGLANNLYVFEYSVQSLCGASQVVDFAIPIDFDNCGLSYSFVDAVSASSILGCKNYAGDEWFDVLDEAGRLRFSINPGDNNSLQSLCWGARFRDLFNGIRTITLNNSPVYFSSRNFYIEPNQLTVGTNPVGVRLYYFNDDIERLLNYLRNNGFPSATVNDLRILKKKAGAGSPVDLEVSVDTGSPLSLYTFITPTVHRLGTSQFASWYFEFEVSSFSELALVYSTGTVLPVTWLSVTGQLNGSKSIIKWSTASEINTASFTVEHSIDGINFTPLQTVAATGNSSRVNNYQFENAGIKAGTNYYRIRQTDKDGKYSYSKIVTLQYRKNGMPMVLAPNPTRNQLSVWLPESSGGCTIRIFNQLGQMMQQQPVPIGATQLKVNTSKLQPGYYRLQLMQPGNSQSLPFIKQ